MTRDEIFAAIVAWTKAELDPETGRPVDRLAWIDAEEGISTALGAENDAGWLRIIADAEAGAALREGRFKCRECWEYDGKAVVCEKCLVDAALGARVRKALQSGLDKVRGHGTDQPQTIIDYARRWATMYNSDTGHAIADALEAEQKERKND